ncbi:Lon protease 2 [compost metagenome]
MTGEISIHGKVKPVGGVIAKVEAAFQAGATTVIIPKDNWQALFADLNGLQVIPVESIQEVFHHVFGKEVANNLEETLILEISDPYLGTASSLLQAKSVRPGQVTDSGSF